MEKHSPAQLTVKKGNQMSDIMEMPRASRDVRTLLLCKIQKDFTAHYKNLYAPKGSQKLSFMTMGGFDAVSIYPTLSKRKANSPGWAEYIYEDKVNIISAMDENISYHPIHLVTYCDTINSLWTAPKEQFPFLAVTFVYGIDKQRSTYEAPANRAKLDQSTSIHERLLQNYLLQKGINDNKTKYAVYHAVNLSDLIILWFTSDISYTLRVIAAIEQEGIARKTFTSVGFPLDGDKLYRDYKIPSESTPPFNLRISGTIKDYPKFLDAYSALTTQFGAGQYAAYFSNPLFSTFGEDDFSVDTDPVNTSFLVDLFEYWLENAEHWGDACWEIHTDIMCQKDTDSRNSYLSHSGVNDILTGEYRKYRKAFDSHLCNYPWASKLLELLGVYLNIDRNPVLHGPGYLVHGCIRIANAYFCGEISGFPKNSDSLTVLLHDSQDSIERFVRNWSQLTDQVTRIDDVILHGMGNIVAINNTLPEFIVDCYHALMHDFVDILVSFDQRDHRMDGIHFEYDFLFVPELNQRMRISKMFDTEGKHPTTMYKGSVWPEKQAYLMEFPTKYIYQPKTFFLQLVHECLHCFGDTLRLRILRADNMACFVAAHFMIALGFDEPVYTPLFSALASQLAMDENSEELYLEVVIQKLSDKALWLASREGLKEIYHTANSLYYLYSTDSVQNWTNLDRFYIRKDGYNISLGYIMDSCKYYFKECYADAMSIAFLNLSPQEYFSLFLDELPAPEKLEAAKKADDEFYSNIYVIIQRIALVLAACIETNFFSEDACKQALQDVFAADYPSVCYDVIKVIDSLINEASLMPAGKWYQPSLALFYVSDYIVSTLQNFQFQMQQFSSEQFKKFSRRFQSIILEENLFGLEFYEVIQSGHDRVLNCP